MPMQVGVTHTLDEVIECPQVVKHMLNDENGIGSTYLGSRWRSLAHSRAPCQQQICEAL